MMHRMFTLGLAALALMVFVGTAARADETKGTDNSHSGLVVSAGNHKLVMTDKEGKNEMTHTVSADAKITCDGKECKLDELKRGTRVTVTTEKGDKTVATRIEGHTKDRDNPK
jgi:hypothetical protein